MSLAWRREQWDERFQYGLCFMSPNRGYALQSRILLHNHTACGCLLAKTPIQITWFLPHDVESHVEFPISEREMADLRQQLVEEMPWSNIGFCVHLSPTASYGSLYTLEEVGSLPLPRFRRFKWAAAQLPALGSMD